MQEVITELVGDNSVQSKKYDSPQGKTIGEGETVGGVDLILKELEELVGLG